ncbi:MAG: hypothetical protein JNM00_06935 [Flavobacteriales bacterium]|nr:hypothetical protein [Flavobacteriales bacterium]
MIQYTLLILALLAALFYLYMRFFRRKSHGESCPGCSMADLKAQKGGAKGQL